MKPMSTKKGSNTLINSARKVVRKKMLNKKKDGPSPFEIQRVINDNIARDNMKLISIDNVLASDILGGRGGGKTHDEGHQAYLDLKDQYHNEYIGYDTHEEKQQCVTNVIDTLKSDGRRFLSNIKGMKGFYREMTVEEIRRKVQQALREPRKAKLSSCNPCKTTQTSSPFINDVKDCDEPAAAHALDTDVDVDEVITNECQTHGSEIGSEIANECQTRGSEISPKMKIDIMHGDGIDYYQIFSDCYQDNAVEGTVNGMYDNSMHDQDDDFTTEAEGGTGRTYNLKRATYSTFYEDMDAIGHPMKLPNFHDVL